MGKLTGLVKPVANDRRARRSRVATASLETLEGRVLFAGTPGSTLATADNLGNLSFTTQTLNGYVGAVSPDAYYQFSTATTTDVSMTLASTGSGGAGLQLGQVMSGNAQGFDNGPSLHQVLPPGAYYIDVSSTDATYALTVAAAAAPSGPGGTPGTGANLGQLPADGGQAYSDWVGNSDPSDVYNFTLSNATDVTLSLGNGDVSYEFGRDLNHNGKIDSGEILIGSEGTGGTVHQLLPAGSYFIDVNNNRAFLNNTDAYYTLNVVEGVSNAVPVPTPIPGSGPTPTPTPVPTPTPTPTPAPTPTPTSVDPFPPQAAAPGLPDSTAGSTVPYVFNVTFTDNAALRNGTLSARTVSVIGPDGSSLPVSLESVTAVSAVDQVATFQVPPLTSPGQYHVVLVGGQLADAAGNYAAQQTLGTFSVAGAPPTVSTPSPTPTSPTPTPTSTATAPVVTLTGGLPAAATGGNKGVLLFRFANASAALEAGLVTVNLFASTTTTLDGSAVPLGPSVRERLRLSPGSAKQVRLNYAIPATLADGSYYVLARVNPSGAVFASADPVRVTAPFVDLAAAFPPHPTLTIAPAGKGFSVVTVTNLGNAPARGLLRVSLSATPAAGGAAFAVADSARPINLKAGAGKTFRVRFRLPAAVPAGSYHLEAVVDPLDVFRDPSRDNNAVADTAAFTVG